MITRHPLGRHDLAIKRKDMVLEIGSGHNPMYRSDVIADKYMQDNTHRCGEILIYPHQQFIKADGELLQIFRGGHHHHVGDTVVDQRDRHLFR